MNKQISIEMMEEMLNKKLSEEEGKIVDILSGLEKQSQATLLELMLHYGDKRWMDAKNEKYVPNEANKQTIESLLELNTDQIIGVIGFLVARLYNNEDFNVAIQEAVGTFSPQK
ncbi:hypothetical protein [Paenibacillus sp. Leaf72]|uniref:hypothetical protein n=1 Tax=Paenibacillus sp. Leaf72 TaxID=1736234 RepID=UPI0006F3FF7B|nr:hypothetical protein [Paenibacillus sp. Leaf72]KQN96906.1 hypothetical protein ASF12_22825 [Paenibacillus sp. Leaf72]